MCNLIWILILITYSVFNRAVACFSEYRSECLANETYYANKLTSATVFDQISEGPLGLTMELCNNEKFRQGNSKLFYSSHKHNTSSFFLFFLSVCMSFLDYLILGPCQKRYRGQFDQCLRMSTAPAPTKLYPGYGSPHQQSPRTKLEMFIENCW